jgi:hypothetical protein
MSLWQDLINRADEIECRDFVLEKAPRHVVEHLMNAQNRSWLRNADGLYFRDQKTPFFVTDNAVITLSTTALDLYDVTQYGALPANYWIIGKQLKVTAFGKITTAVTPGNGVASLSVNPTVNTTLVSSSAKALTASQTNLSWKMEGYFRCRAAGSSGTFQMHGHFIPNVAVMASTLQPVLIPDSAPTTAAQSTIAATNVRLEFSRSGSTAETMTTTELVIEALN